MLNKIKANPRQLFFIPYFLFVLILVIIPLIFILVNSFIPPTDSWDYEDTFSVWKDPGFWFIFFKSFGTGFLVAGISLAISLPYVYILVSLKNKAMQIMMISLIVSPLFLFTLVKILALRGILTIIFDVPIDNYGFLVLGLVYLNLPFMIIPLYNVLNNMPQNIVQASLDLGYTKLATFVKVVIPYGLKAICSGIIMVFLLVIMSVAMSDKLLDNPAGNQLIGNIINDWSNPSNPFDMQKASSVVLITFIGASFVYFGISAIPIIYRKIKGGINE